VSGSRQNAMRFDLIDLRHGAEAEELKESRDAGSRAERMIEGGEPAIRAGAIRPLPRRFP
jgi:hypothetical protein